MRASLQPSWRSIFSGTWLDFTPESDLKSFFSPIHETKMEDATGDERLLARFAGFRVVSCS